MKNLLRSSLAAATLSLAFISLLQARGVRAPRHKESRALNVVRYGRRGVCYGARNRSSHAYAFSRIGNGKSCSQSGCSTASRSAALCSP